MLELEYQDKFPYRLHDLLESASRDGFDDVVSWLPCGTMFRVHKQRNFQEEIIPKFFPGMASYKSFRRQLNLYGIRQTEQTEKSRGIYSHPFLLRDKRLLCCNIKRKKRKSTKELKGNPAQDLEGSTNLERRGTDRTAHSPSSFDVTSRFDKTIAMVSVRPPNKADNNNDGESSSSLDYEPRSFQVSRQSADTGNSYDQDQEHLFLEAGMVPLEGSMAGSAFSEGARGQSDSMPNDHNVLDALAPTVFSELAAAATMDFRDPSFAESLMNSLVGLESLIDDPLMEESVPQVDPEEYSTDEIEKEIISTFLFSI